MQLKLSAFLQWKINILLCQKLGWNFALFYIMILGNIYFIIKRKEKKKIKEAIKMVFANQKTKTEIDTIVKRTFRGILWHYFEKLFNSYSSVEKLKTFFSRCIKSKGITAIEQGISKGKGVLLITGHIGGIEYIPGYLAAHEYPVTILAKFSSNCLRETSMKKAGKFAAKIIDANDCPNIVKAILHDLKENRIVITQCDEIEEWRPSLYEVSFLGKRINLDKTLNALIKRGGATIVFAVMQRFENQQYQFFAQSWEEILGTFGQSVNKSNGEVVLKSLEKYIYHHPEEWYQWKNVSEIKTAEGRTAPVNEIRSPVWMKPALEGIS